MFEEFLGLPLHVLVIHAVIALIPISALVGVLFTLVSSWRWFLRWPLVGLAVAAPIVTIVTVRAGEALKEGLNLPDQVIGTHEARGQLLLIFVLVFAVISIAAAMYMGGPSQLASGRGGRRGAAYPAQMALGVLLVAASVLIVVQLGLTGDAGARAVWEGRI